MNDRLRQTLLTALPAGVSVALMTARKRYLPAERHKRDAAFLQKAGNPTTVLQGPFMGMKYLDVAFFGPTVDKKLGVYELELRSACEALIAADPDVVVDVGTAEGYYAAGFAYRLPRAQVFGYDISKVARCLTSKLARLNGAQTRVHALGECSPPELERVLGPAKRPALISDCEGYEDVLLDPAKVPALKRTIMIVELHDMNVAGVSKRIRERFTATHDITEYRPEPRTAAHLPPGCALTAEELIASTHEGRTPESAWFLLKPR